MDDTPAARSSRSAPSSDQTNPALLLATKLYIPPPRPNLVARPRLLARLDAGQQHPLTLISAPAGFGKTTLLSDWIQHRPAETRWPVAWLSLDEHDNDPLRFWSYVIAALERAHGPLHVSLAEIGTAPLGSPLSEQLLPAITAMSNALAGAPGDLTLVIDDYHLIEAPAIHDSLAFLLAHLPPCLHLVIASRTDPPFSLARLRAQGALTELRTADLRFTPAEAASFLREVMGLHLAPQELAALEARTEGWIAGLHLAALSMQGREDIPGFLAAFSGSHLYVLDYLADEVMRRQPEEVQRYLLRTSILDRLNDSLCDAVTGCQGSRSMLARLEQANLFLVPLDDQRRWYRYHRLFADVLRERLQQTEPEQLAELHRRAGAWYARREMAAEAIDHLLAGGDFAGAARLVERAGV
ncbi:MAG TPA: hypothetical protein VER55_16210, partial [Ardenticatenaceae bacterium]|nr:hypothetical protein [Ardenticatenaceae bacterium]